MSETLKGIRHSIGTAQEGKAPLLTSDIRRIVAACPEKLSGFRDRALVLVGYAGAFRRSEPAAIDLAHLLFTKDGLVIDLRRSKTDQEAAGRKVGIPFGADDATGPVRALRRWLANSGVIDGPVFRGVNRDGKPSRRGLHKDCVGWNVKRAASRASLKPEPLGGHSLRAGCVTQAAMNGVSERDIMRQTGHKSAETHIIPGGTGNSARTARCGSSLTGRLSPRRAFAPSAMKSWPTTATWCPIISIPAA